MNKGEMAVIATISWIAGLVILAVVFTLTGLKPSDYPGWLLLIIWLTLSKVIHTVLTSGKKSRREKSKGTIAKALLAGKIITAGESDDK